MPKENIQWRTEHPPGKTEQPGERVASLGNGSLLLKIPGSNYRCSVCLVRKGWNPFFKTISLNDTEMVKKEAGSGRETIRNNKKVCIMETVAEK